MVGTAARRYANALLETAIETGSLEKAREDMELVFNTLEASPELQLFVKSPIIKKEDKKEALDTIFKGKVQDLTLDLVGMLSRKKREVLLMDIAKGFLELYNIHHGIIEVDVTSATDLTDAQRKRLLEKLESTTGKKVKLNSSTDEKLIGGLTVRIHDTVIDGSVKYKLRQLKERFTAAAV